MPALFWVEGEGGVAVGQPATSTIPAHQHYSEEDRHNLLECLGLAIRALSVLDEHISELKRIYPPRRKNEYYGTPVSDNINPVVCKKVGREYLYILSPQNITLLTSDFFSPQLSFTVQASVLTLMPFPEGTRLTTSGISDTSPVKVEFIASDERLI